MFTRRIKRESSVSPSRLRLSFKRKCGANTNLTKAFSLKNAASSYHKDDEATEKAVICETTDARTATPKEHLPPPQRLMRDITMEEAETLQNLRNEEVLRQQALL
jgi:hypothetical protein